MTNQQIADVLSQFGDLLDVKGESGFRVSAYRRAAETVKHLDEPVSTLIEENRLLDVKGIGKGIAANLEDIHRLGYLPDLESLQDEIPATLLTILAIPGVGPKTAGRLYRELGITNLEDLEKAVHDGLVSTLKGIGAKQETRILEGIAFLRQRTGRLSIGTALPLAKELSRAIAESCDVRVEVAGSARRGSETVGNLDFIAETGDLPSVLSAAAAHVGADRLTVETQSESVIEAEISGLCRIRIVCTTPDQFGSTLVRLTGSQRHLAELGFDQHPCHSEEEVYERFGLPVIPPELREGTGECEAARLGQLPNLVELAGIQGDLHLHSDWSDGRATIPQLAARARELGYAYLSIADHSHSLAIANGLDAERLLLQRQEIERTQADLTDLRLICANEVEIRRDGSLDFPDEVLARLDLVVASLHSGRNMSRDELTERLLTAIENPHVDIIAHPTGRIVEQRAPAEYDWDAVFEAAARTGTALEINANPARLDLPEDLARRAVDTGVLVSIDSDAHDLAGLDLMEYGVKIARRGWVPAERVINTWDVQDLLAWLDR